MARELLFTVGKKDLEISWFSSPGPGGQKKNKTKNSCRMRHRDSGAEVTAQERRERSANLKAALYRLVEHPKFRVWWARRVHECLEGETAAQAVERMMKPENIRVEVVGPQGTWVSEPVGQE